VLDRQFDDVLPGNHPKAGGPSLGEDLQS
jgi:hypothetical protein